ncbi:MAG: ATP-binding cassette domain-containing protein [bacterium]
MSPRSLIACRDLSFSYDAASEPLISALTAHFPPGFTGIVGANGAGKTTLLHLLLGSLTPTSGTIEGVEDAVYCEQRTDQPPFGLNAFLADYSREAYQLRGRLCVEEDFLQRWDSLSHGERKRAQIAHALWQAPTLLALDEPTNHIDSQARDLLLDSLKRYKGVGLIVSHDRDLLDALCQQCIWLEPPAAQVYSGGLRQANEQKQLHRDSLIRQRARLLQENDKLQRVVNQRREQAASEHKSRSKKGLSAKDSDARGKINRARVTDSKAGNPLRQLAGRSAMLQDRLDQVQVDKTYQTGIWLPGSRSPRDPILKLSAGHVPLDAQRVLKWPQTVVAADDRIALCGPNGIGKSTFLNHIIPLLNVPRERVVSLPQEVTAASAASVLADVQQFNNAALGHIMNVVSRLNSRPERLLASRQPSPGEIRKLMLALGMARTPYILLMDEPTNHLDLPSIQALETALQECPCALVLVSHDQQFIENVGVSRWWIEADGEGHSVLVSE